MNEENTEMISLNDFKSWLQGVEDMQEDGWTPNPTQWKKIRAKINQIGLDSDKPVETAQYFIPPGPVHRNMTPQSSFEDFSIPMPSASGRVSTFVPPPPPAHLENPKTPDIDTSRGSYNAPFI